MCAGRPWSLLRIGAITLCRPSVSSSSSSFCSPAKDVCYLSTLNEALWQGLFSGHLFLAWFVAGIEEKSCHSVWGCRWARDRVRSPRTEVNCSDTHCIYDNLWYNNGRFYLLVDGPEPAVSITLSSCALLRCPDMWCPTTAAFHMPLRTTTDLLLVSGEQSCDKA